MKSDNVKKGMQQAPHRSLFNALGFTEEEMNKPMVGIVSSYNEIVPGWRRAGGISGDRGLRRNCDGTYRYEIFAGDA